MDKPLSFSLYDLVSSVVPGASFLLVVAATQPKVWILTPELLILGVLFFGFIFGLVFLALGNLLYGIHFQPDNLLDGSLGKRLVLILHRVIKFIIRQDHALKGLDIRREISEIWKKKLRQKELDRLSVFQLSDILIHKRGQMDRDDLLAKEAAFRSISAMVLVTSVYLRCLGNFGYPDWVWLGVVIVTLRLLLYGHNYYQKIRQSQVYLSAYLILKGVTNGTK